MDRARQVRGRAAFFYCGRKMADDIGDGKLEHVLGEVYPDVLRFAFSRTRNLADAEDVAQEACLRAWQARARYFQRDGANVIGWLVRAAQRIIIDTARRRKTEGDRCERALSTEQSRLAIPDAEAATGRGRAASSARRIIERLDEDDRVFLGIWAEQRQRDMSREDAARELSMTVDKYEAAKKRLRRAAKAVAKELGIDAAVLLWVDAPEAGSRS